MRVSSLLFTCAIALSATAAYYSIVGLATIFSGAYAAVIIMASILEISKLVIASWLYQKWDEVSSLLRGYLTASVIVLMLITSLGIFGFLSKAHVEQSLNNTAISMRIEQLDQQLQQSTDIMQRYRQQLEQLDRSINIQLDNNRATQALQARQRQTAERDQIRQRLDAETQRSQELQQQRLQLRQQASVLQSEVGPIRYVAEMFLPAGSVDLEQAVRWMIITLVLVFDPLAVLMLIAANMSLARERAALAPAPTDDPVPSIVPPVEQRPLGEVLYVGDQPMRWWNGTAWERFEDPVDTQQVIDAIHARMRDIMVSGLSYQLDSSELSRLIKESMDDWLTRAAEQPQSQEQVDDTPITHADMPQDEPTPDHAVSESVQDATAKAPVAEGPIPPPPEKSKFIEPKPSWL